MVVGSSATATHRAVYLELAVGLVRLRGRYYLLLLVGRGRGAYRLHLLLLNDLGGSLAHWVRL